MYVYFFLYDVMYVYCGKYLKIFNIRIKINIIFPSKDNKYIFIAFLPRISKYVYFGYEI